MADGELRGAWAAEYEEHWRPRLNPIFDDVDSQDLFVISWGPGEGSEYYSKRAELIEHMRTMSKAHVMTPEWLIREDERFRGIDAWDAEEVQAVAVADLVICLEVDDARVTGVPAEVLRLGQIPRVREILRLLLPKRPKDAPRP